MSAKTKSTYLRGLGDLYLKVQVVDVPATVIDPTESLTNYVAIGGVTLLTSDTNVISGSKSVNVLNVTASGNGVQLNPAGGSVDLSTLQTGLLLVNIYPTQTGPMDIVLSDGVNSKTYKRTCTAAQWNRALVDLTAPTSTVGTLAWNNITKINVLAEASGNNFYVDSYSVFTSLANTASERNVRIGCLADIQLNTADTVVELKCSDNSLIQSDIAATKINIKGKVQDFDPEGVAILAGGIISTSNVTQLITAEAFNVPIGAAPSYTLAQSSQLRIGNGYGVFVYKQSGEMLKQSPDANIIPQGYYYVNTATGVLKFNSADGGIPLLVDYNTVATNGKTLQVPSSRNLLQFSLQFQVKGSNSKKALLFFANVKSDAFNVAPSKDQFWQWDFSGQVLADTVTGNYYEYHVVES